MKKIVGIFILAVPLFFTGCNDPEETDCIFADKRFCDPNFNGGDIGRGIVEFSGNTANYTSKVLLEDFTGFRCNNCLPAINTAKNLKAANPDRLSIVGVHCTSFFAAPLTDDPSQPFHTDFRTPEGELYVTHYNIQGLPTGVINRQGDGVSETINFSLWTDRVNSLLATNNPEVFVQIEDITLNADTTKASINLIAKPLQSSSKSYLINAAVTEDGIMEAQKDNDTPGGEILDFVHNHVLRYSSYGEFGIPAFTGDIELAQNQALAFELEIEIFDNWVPENCEIVVYISDEASLNVVQVEETHLIE